MLNELERCAQLFDIRRGIRRLLRCAARAGMGRGLGDPQADGVRYTKMGNGAYGRRFICPGTCCTSLSGPAAGRRLARPGYKRPMRA
jgi:hypothetical protein